MAAGPGSGPKGCGFSPREADTAGSGEAPVSGLLVRQRQPLAGTRRLWGQKRQHIHYISSPHPGAAVGKMISWGFYLLFLLCDQCTSLCCCSTASQACVRPVIYGVFTEQELIGAAFPKAWEGPWCGEPGGKTKSKRVSSVRNKQFPSTQREGSNAGG